MGQRKGVGHDEPSASCHVPEWAGRDHADRNIHDIMAMTDAELENGHDYIQWLFPSLAASLAVPGSPVLSRDEIRVIRNVPAAQDNLQAAITRMFEFYRANRGWLVWEGHNHKRITRIIRCIWLLVDADDAEDFYDDIMAMVIAAGRPVSPTSLAFWRDAAGLERCS